MKWKRGFREALVLLGLAALGAVAVKAFHPYAPALYLQNEPLREDEVTVEMVAERWGEEGVIWIDARQVVEFEAGHIPGAMLLNKQGWTDQLWEIWSVLEAGDIPVVVYCDSAACKASREIAERLRQNTGRGEVYTLRGGWEAYRASRSSNE
ncbi:MAG: rhodanese-like domain-containing protein [Verrucomicrobiota bacterium]